MTISYVLEYTINILFGMMTTRKLSKREENRAKTTIDVLSDMMDGKEIPKKDKISALCYAYNKIGDISLNHDDFNFIKEVEDVLSQITKSVAL